jgi:hypothetical protein
VGAVSTFLLDEIHGEVYTMNVDSRGDIHETEYQVIRNVAAHYSERGGYFLLPALVDYKLRGAVVGMIDSIFGKKNRRARLKFLSDALGRRILSSDDLTVAEARALRGWMLADECGYHVDGRGCGWTVQEPAREFMEAWLKKHQYLCEIDPGKVEQLSLLAMEGVGG